MTLLPLFILNIYFLVFHLLSLVLVNADPVSHDLFSIFSLCGLRGGCAYQLIFGGDCVFYGVLWVLGCRCPYRVVLCMDLLGPVGFRGLGLVSVTFLA